MNGQDPEWKGRWTRLDRVGARDFRNGAGGVMTTTSVKMRLI